MRFLLGIAKVIDTINEYVGRGVSWITSLLVAVIFVDVILRYLFSLSFVFTQELEWHLFGFIFLLGAGYTLLHDGHVRVDIIYQRLGPKGQAWINLLGCIIFMAPGCYLVISTSMGYVYESWSIMEGSPDPGGIPYRFLIKGCIPVGFMFLALQGISLFIRSLAIVTGHEQAEREAH